MIRHPQIGDVKTHHLFFKGAENPDIYRAITETLSLPVDKSRGF